MSTEICNFAASIAEDAVNGMSLAREAQESLSAGWQYNFRWK